MSTTTITLAAFLKDRLDEDERYLKSNRRHLWTERPLREVEAKRAILANLQSHERALELRHLDVNQGAYLVLLDACQRLAAVYSDHGEWRQEW